ncbi:MAG TPA: type II CAAX endopeptidase family protein [Polyangiales bacterium]|nr:type II CAAX endopeptidase family protein [Polyangiales bacterium]
MIEGGFGSPSPRNTTLLRIGGAICLITMLACLAWGGVRVAALERSELDLQTAPATLRDRSNGDVNHGNARLARVSLHAGQSSEFELCSRDGLEAARWEGTVDFAIVQLESKQLMVRTPLDRANLARVQRNREAGCLELGTGPIEKSGTYTVEAIWMNRPLTAAVLDSPLTIHISARFPLQRSDLWATLLLGLSMLGGLWLALAVAPRGEHEPVGRMRAGSLGLVALALAILYGASELPLFGAAATLLKGVLLFGVQVALACLFARGSGAASRARALGLVAPPKMGRALACAFAAWPLLVASARLSLHWVPSTGEAPIENFIAWPSGMLATALLGVLLPAAEELFFRGYLYGALLPLGRLAAGLISVCLFGLLHVEQSWGNWGGLVAVFAVGALLCALRVVSGSTLISALCHVAYNLTLSIMSIAASVRG